MEITGHPSPNFGERRGGVTPDMIVLHYTAMATVDALARLCDPDHEVSAHFLIAETGEIFQLVDEAKRAWHAGAGAWGACEDVNSASVGIELANSGCSPFAATQMDILEQLLCEIMGRWSIPAERVIGHSDLAYPRKVDPGCRFDWKRLALAGYSVWPDKVASQDVDQERFSRDARAFGFRGAGGERDHLGAFRLRFRPWASGPLDGADMAVMNDLARRFAVDPGAPNA